MMDSRSITEYYRGFMDEDKTRHIVYSQLSFAVPRFSTVLDKRTVNATFKKKLKNACRRTDPKNL